MLKVEDLKIEKKYEKLTPETKEQLKALENLIVADGEIHSPIVVWRDRKIVIDGHSRVKILKKHPELKHTIKEIAFSDWQDVRAWIVEHHIARRSFTLYQKLEMAMNCVDYWKAKEEAKRNQGTRSDLMSPGDKKLDNMDTNTIIAEKVGCGRTTVTHFMKVFNKATEATKQRCREADLSIKNAYMSLTSKKTPPKKKAKTVIDTETTDILDECEKNQSVGKKSDINIPDPKPIATKMTTTQIPPGSIWFAINPIDGVIQVFKKTLDHEKGIAHIQVNNFACKTISKENGITLVEANHIDGTTEEISQKDNINFNEVSKKAS